MHLKRMAMPRSWPLAKKGKTFMVRGVGPHPMKICIPVLVLLRDVLKEVKTRKEAKKILKEGNVLVDNRPIKNEKFGVGLFDRIYLKKLEKAFTITIGKKGKIKVQEINKDQLNKKVCKVIGKKILRGKKIQINLHDGKNFITDDTEIKVGDSIVLDVKANKPIGHLELKEGCLALVIKGRHTGQNGKITKVDDKISIVIEKNTFEIPRENVIVVGA
ncbi:MAG: hypothetical protein K6T16_01930 [Candidatus Pacearchaeota archaeon]|nr:hypothetical protein [Candidatus Pacearchaeota archaeon]